MTDQDVTLIAAALGVPFAAVFILIALIDGWREDIQKKLLMLGLSLMPGVMIALWMVASIQLSDG